MGVEPHSVLKFMCIVFAVLLAGCVCPKIPEAPEGYYLCEKCNKYLKYEGYESVWDHLMIHYKKRTPKN